MPKKRSATYKQLTGPSSSKIAESASYHGGNQATVNERLHNLRLEETTETLRKKRELASSSFNQPSVPPDIRNILGVPETAPPRPKVGLRLRDRMRTPGPAPPKSWLGFEPTWQPIMAARRKKGKQVMVRSAPRPRPGSLKRFSQMIQPTTENTAPSVPTLSHSVLKTLAENWHYLDEEDYPALAEIPLQLRLELLSFLGCYGPPIDTAAFQALTQGSEAVTCLDLAALVGHGGLTLKKLMKLLDATKNGVFDAEHEVAESWDAEVPADAVLASSFSAMRFQHLTHLCLSHPPSTASWNDLLSLSKGVPQLTHLSLAYWPRPTLTPNLATATVVTRHSPSAITAGGSHIYSGIDQDLTEPASLLRQLSGNLLCLQWLDLEGCAEWMPALATSGSDARHRQGEDDGWSMLTSTTVMTIFLDTWKNLSYISCSQGWLPSVSGVMMLPLRSDDRLKEEIARHLVMTGQESSNLDDVYDVAKRKANMWMETETRVRAAARWINSVRRARRCKPVEFDFGWTRKAL